MNYSKFLDGSHELGSTDFTVIPSARNAELHSHAFVEIVYFYNGRGLHKIEGNTFNIHSGDVFFINPGTKHRYETFAENDKPIQVYNILFMPEFLGSDYAEVDFISTFRKKMFNIPEDVNAPKYLAIHGDIKHNIISIFNLIIDEYKNKTTDEKTTNMVIKNLLNTLLIKLFVAEQISNKTKLLPVDTNQLITEALAYINVHCCEPLCLAKVAKQYNYSSQYFNKLMQHQTGTSFNQYLQKQRMLIAADLLKSTEKTIDEICGSVGYVDLKHFYYIFKKHLGVSPAKYRSFIKKQKKATEKKSSK